MKLHKKANGAQYIRLTMNEWLEIGKTAGWVRDMTPEDFSQVAEQMESKLERIKAEIK